MLMTVKEVAAMWRVSPMTVYRAIKCGELTATRVGRSFRIPSEAVSVYMNVRQVSLAIPDHVPENM